MGSNFDDGNQFHDGKYYNQMANTIHSQPVRSSLFSDENSYFQYEIQRLKETNLELRRENTLWKDQVNDATKSDEHHLTTIANMERTLREERDNYRQLLQTMVQTAEENADLVVKMESLRTEKDAQVVRLEEEKKSLIENMELLRIETDTEIDLVRKEKDVQINLLEKEKKSLEGELRDVKCKLNEIETNFDHLQKLFDRQEASVNNVKSMNKQVTKYKLECQKLKEELQRSKEGNFGISPDPSFLVIQKKTEDGIEKFMATTSNLLETNAIELQKLEKENQALKDQLTSREKQCTDILIQAKVRILGLQETFKLHQTEVNSYKERILIMDRQNKEEILKKETLLKETSKKLSTVETEKSRLSNDFERVSRRCEVLTQEVDILQKSSSLQQESSEGVNIDLDSVIVLDEIGMNSMDNRFPNLSETEMNNINNFVLRPVPLTTNSAQDFTNDLFPPPSSPYDSRCSVEYVDCVENSQKLEAMKRSNGEDFRNLNFIDNNLYTNVTCHSGNDFEHALPKKYRRNSYQPSRRKPVSEFKCNLCNERCSSKKSLKKHKERVHKNMRLHTTTGNSVRKDYRRRDRRHWY